MKALLLVAGSTMLLASSAPRYPVAMVLHGCSPSDGPAIRLTLARSGKACGPKATDTLTLSLYRGAPETGTTYDFAATPSIGSTNRCPKPGACEMATKATVRFDAFADGKSATGHWTATFKDGAALEGDFDAVFCNETPAPCG